MQFIFDFVHSLSWGNIGLGVLLFLFSLGLSFIAIVLVVVKIPANYFSTHYKQDFMPDSSWIVRWGATILKNLLGLGLIILGVFLSLPGIPGQGLLTILLGIMMLDIPGKRPFEARLIKRPTILNAVNNLRARYNKPPLLMD